MEVFKTYLFFEGYDEGHSYLIDTIHFENQWWLVGDWLQKPDANKKYPGNMVCLSGLRYQEVNGEEYRFILNNSLPHSLFGGEVQDGYTIKKFPMIHKMPGKKGKH